LALFAASASAFLGYIYGVTAGEVSRRADGEISREIQSLLGTYRQAGMDGLNLALIERTGDGRAFVYLLSDKTGKRMTGTLAVSPVDLTAGPKAGDQVSATFQLTQTDPDGALIKSAARGQQVRLDNGATLFVGLDIGEGQSFVLRIVRAIWGAGALVLLLGLAGGLVVSRNVSRAMARLNQVVTEVQGGNLGVRIPLRGVRDEFDELAAGMNDMLDRLERSIGGLRHVGDSIALAPDPTAYAAGTGPDRCRKWQGRCAGRPGPGLGGC
jgi:methyl-accepting chemotaxis protein